MSENEIEVRVNKTGQVVFTGKAKDVTMDYDERQVIVGKKKYSFDNVTVGSPRRDTTEWKNPPRASKR